MKQLRNEHGLSLAELLATLVIGSIILIFITSLLIFVQKQYTDQSTSAKQLTDVTIVAKAITKDARFYDVKEVEGNMIVFEDGPTYTFEHEIVYKDGAPFVYDIVSFQVIKSGNELALNIKSEKKEIETKIMIRQEENGDEQ